MKVYKNLFKTLFIGFLALSFVFVSCKKDEKEPVVVEDTNEIVGAWQLTAIEPETPGTTIPALAYIPAVGCVYNLVFTFKSDNNVSASGCDAAVSLMGNFIPIADGAKWKVENKSLILTGNNITQTMPIEQNPTTMKVTVNTNLTGSGTPVNAVMSFKRL